jgi:Zn-dependent protease with chaperone function
MHVSKILKKGKLERYYKVPTLNRRCTVSCNRIFLDTNYFNMLLPEELLAVGAHEFNHINKNHNVRRFSRIIFPSSVYTIIILVILANVNIKIIPLSHGLVGIIILFAIALSPLFVLIAFFYINAEWLRQQETECDLSAVKFVSGEAMISALLKLKKLDRNEKKLSDLPLAPKLYPSHKQRIADIRSAIKNQNN